MPQLPNFFCPTQFPVLFGEVPPPVLPGGHCSERVRVRPLFYVPPFYFFFFCGSGPPFCCLFLFLVLVCYVCFVLEGRETVGSSPRAPFLEKTESVMMRFPDFGIPLCRSFFVSAPRYALPFLGVGPFS